MAAPTYSTDLTDIITDPTSSTGWTLIASSSGGASSFTVPEIDDYIQSGTPGTYGCISRNPWSSSIRGMVYNSAQTIPSGSAVFIWTKSDVAQALNTKANGGIQALIGSGTGALNCYYVSGSDDAFGGWKVYPIDPTITPSTTVGSPTSTTSYFGVRWDVPSSGPSKGFPFKIDAIRYGSTITSTNGDLSNGYATFSGASAYDGDISRSYGLFFLQNGVYLHQGNFQMGTSATAVDFRDSNRTIFIQSTDFVSSGFNRFEVNNASSYVEWKNISIRALGTVSRGDFEVVDNATVIFDSNTLTDMGTFIFQSNSNISATTFRRCDTITAGGATLSGCTFSNSIAAVSLSTSTLSNITDNTFVSDGSNHAVDLGTVSATTSMDWSNYLSGYAATDGSTGNEAIKVNVASGQTLTINVGDGYSTPSIYNTGTGSVAVVTGTRTVKIAVSSISGAVSGANVYLQAAAGGSLPYEASVSVTRSATTATVSHTAHGLVTGDKVNIKGITDKIEDNTTHTINKIDANSYSFTTTDTGSTSYTGTITSTFVFLRGIASSGTNSNEISMSRSIPSDQPVVGWARKSTSAPYYKQGDISGIVSSSANTIFSPILISDE